MLRRIRGEGRARGYRRNATLTQNAETLSLKSPNKLGLWGNVFIFEAEIIPLYLTHRTGFESLVK